jgi:prevent-host-death family protein
MASVGVHEAKTKLSELLRRAENGEEVTICRGSQPIARLVPIAGESPRRLGIDAGQLDVPDDFDEPLPDEHLEAFG